MKKRVVVLIDGENFRYSLKGLFPSRFNYLPQKANWLKLFSLPLSEDHELIRIYWYVVDSLHFRPFEIPKSDYELETILGKVVSTKLELRRNKSRKKDYLKEKFDQPTFSHSRKSPISQYFSVGIRITYRRFKLIKTQGSIFSR